MCELRSEQEIDLLKIHMKNHLVLAGGAGFLGRKLAAYFQESGVEIVILTRSPEQTFGDGRIVLWDARTPSAWTSELEGATAIINLTGKSVNCRYHARNRREIMDSRVDSTRVIGEAIRRCAKPPSVWLNASTATIYKHTYGEAWDENGVIGATPEAKDEFSIEVATAWERELDEAHTPATRKIAMRMAMVLGAGKNSVFPVLRRLARVGLGGRMGSGRQYVSWIHEIDYCRAVEWLITHDELSGGINLASPNPLPNDEMMRVLRKACGTQFGLPAANWMLEVGAFFLRTETELLIKSRRVIPRRLIDSGFEFRFPAIRGVFDNLLMVEG